jgi:hypothetical protein
MDVFFPKLKSYIGSKEYPGQYQQPEPPAEDIVVMEKNTPGMPGSQVRKYLHFMTIEIRHTSGASVH